MYQSAVLMDYGLKGIPVYLCHHFSLYRLTNNIFNICFVLFCSPIWRLPPNCREHSNPRVASASQASHLPVVLTGLPPHTWPDRSIIVPYALHGSQTMPSGLFGISVDRLLRFPGHRVRIPAALHIRKVVGMLYMKLSMSNRGNTLPYSLWGRLIVKMSPPFGNFFKKFPSLYRWGRIEGQFVKKFLKIISFLIHGNRDNRRQKCRWIEKPPVLLSTGDR